MIWQGSGKKTTIQWLVLLLGLLSCGFYLLLAYWVPRTAVYTTIGLYSALFLMYGGLLYLANKAEFLKPFLLFTFLFRLLFIVAIPELSDDFLRFIWDGNLSAQGVSPYAFKPSVVDASLVEHLSAEIRSLALSKDYYSIYPSVPQFVFWLSVKFSGGGVFWSVVGMRLLMLLAEGGSIWLLVKLLHHFNIPRKRVLLYAANPLIIVELVGNLHAEGYMIFLVLLAIWLLVSGKRWLSAVAMGLAIVTKLWPLMFLVFFLKRLGWRKGLVYGAIACSIAALSFLPFNFFAHYLAFFESMQLYFGMFEFNGSIYYFIRWLGFKIVGWNVIQVVGPFLSLGVFIGVILIAWLDRSKTKQSLFKAFSFALCTYLLLGTTVEPWYLAPLVAFAMFTRYRFAVVWSAVIPLTYLVFASATYKENILVIIIEYCVVLGWLVVELLQSPSMRRWQVKRAARIKVQRIKPYLSNNQEVLDIGTGNGGLCYLLQAAGIRVKGVDIANKSLFSAVIPTVYDGKVLPFETSSIEVVMAITVLHHIKQPEKTLREMVRCSSSRLIIMEDVYKNNCQKYLTYFMDSLVNWEWKGHPHTNKTADEWEQLFSEFDLEIVDRQDHRLLLFFKQVTYHLQVRHETGEQSN